MPRRKKRGRPATGRDPLVCVRIPQWLLEKIDNWDASAPLGTRRRSSVIRRLIGVGLEAWPRFTEDPKNLKKPRRKKRKSEISSPAPIKRSHSGLPPRKIFIGGRTLTKS